MLDSLIHMDISVLNYLRSFVDPSSIFQITLVHIGTDLEIFMVMLLLVGLWLYGAYRKDDQPKTDALMILYSIGLAFGMYLVFNLGLPFRPRPESVTSIRPLIDHLPDNSFPSGHAIFAGASVLAAFLYTKRYIAWILCITGLIMVASRVIAGIHYPGDILVGVIIGGLGASVVYCFRNKAFMKDYLLVYPVKIAAFFRL